MEPLLKINTREENSIVHTLKNMTLPKRTSGPRPQAAKAIIPTAGINLSTRGLPRKVMYDLHDVTIELSLDALYLEILDTESEAKNQVKDYGKLQTV